MTVSQYASIASLPLSASRSSRTTPENVPPRIRRRTTGFARTFFSQAVERIDTMYALLPLRIARTHLRRALPVLRPVVVSTPKPAGGRTMNPGSISALRQPAARGVRMNGLCRALRDVHEATRSVNVPWNPNGT